MTKIEKIFTSTVRILKKIWYEKREIETLPGQVSAKGGYPKPILNLPEEPFVI